MMDSHTDKKMPIHAYTLESNSRSVSVRCGGFRAGRRGFMDILFAGDENHIAHVHGYGHMYEYKYVRVE